MVLRGAAEGPALRDVEQARARSVAQDGARHDVAVPEGRGPISRNRSGWCRRLGRFDARLRRTARTKRITREEDDKSLPIHSARSASHGSGRRSL